MSKPCTICESVYHTQTFCPLKPRKPIKTYKLPNKIGKAGKLTANAVAKWKKTQKPNHQGYWQCYICGKMIDYLIAEHVKSKVRHPELRTDQDNFKPVCNECNAIKGSKDN